MAWLRIAFTLLAMVAAPAAAQGEPDLAALRVQAERGDAAAQTELGARYFRGKGVPQDDAQAAHWLLRAAEQGDPDAQNKIGFMRAQGRGLPQDDVQAAAWYRRAAEQGSAKGQFNFGLACDEGRGVPGDPTQAVEWWLKAAAQGHSNAQLKLAVAYSRGRGVRSNPALAFFFAELVASRLPENAPTAQRQGILDLRDSLASALAPCQVADAKRSAAAWRPEVELGNAAAAGR